jgi:hypothetical protein
VYDVLQRLPMDVDHMRTSQLGPVLFVLAQSAEETPANRAKLEAIMQRMSRKVFGLQSSYGRVASASGSAGGSGAAAEAIGPGGNDDEPLTRTQEMAEMLANQQRLGLVSRGARNAGGSAPGFAPGAAGGGVVDSLASAVAAAGAGLSILDPLADPAALTMLQLLGDDAAADAAVSRGGSLAPGASIGGAAGGAGTAAGAGLAPPRPTRHASIPQPIVMDFVHRPAPTALTAPELPKYGKSKAKDEPAGSATAVLHQKMLEARRKGHKKPDSRVKLSIEGRGTTS